MPVAPPSGAQIAAAGRRYAGQRYVYGGNASSPGDWDCSSFISYVLGHDLALSLPSGRWGDPGFPPNSHGPVVVDYSQWAGAVTVTRPEPGDLVIWDGLGAGGHIGIYLGPNQMVSALDTRDGTLVSPIAGYGPGGGDPTAYRRVTGLSGGTTPSPPGSAGSGRGGVNVLGLVLVAAGVAAAGLVLLAAAGAILGTEAGMFGFTRAARPEG